MDDLDDLMSPEELAETLDLSVQALAQRRYKREGPPYLKIGRRILYDRAEVVAWVRAEGRSGS